MLFIFLVSLKTFKNIKINTVVIAMKTRTDKMEDNFATN
jgi:hypothetical protein